MTLLLIPDEGHLNYGVPHQISAEESLFYCYNKRNQNDLANFSQSFS